MHFKCVSGPRNHITPSTASTGSTQGTQLVNPTGKNICYDLQKHLSNWLADVAGVRVNGICILLTLTEQAGVGLAGLVHYTALCLFRLHL